MNARRLAIVAIAVFFVAAFFGLASANAAIQTFDSPADAAAWTVNRFAPAGFASGVDRTGRPNRDARGKYRWKSIPEQFFLQLPGRVYDVGLTTPVQTVSIDLYVRPELANQ